MKIYYNKKILCKKAKIFSNFFQKAKGLMFSRNFKKFDGAFFVLPYESIAFSSVHSFFVFFPIDIVWINNKKEIVDAKTLRPFTPHYSPRKKAKYFLELPKGTIKKFGLEIDKKLKFFLK